MVTKKRTGQSRLLHAEGFRCLECSQEFPLDVMRYECSSCGWPLEVIYSTGRFSVRGARSILEKARTLWDYYSLLPVADEASIVSLGEGGTPLLPSSRILKNKAPFSLFLKNEGLNPTGSFKDRPLSVIASKAREYNIPVLIIASSGNAGVALAAYAAAGGFRSIVLAPLTVPKEKIVAIRAYGADVFLVDGTACEALSLVNTVSTEKGWFNANTSLRNPFGIEADKTVAYEIAKDLGFVSPDYVLIPISAGQLLVGCYRGFCDLVEWGILDRIPRLVGVQAEGCAPIAAAFENGRDAVKPWGKPQTVAWGIADPLRGYEKDGTVTLRTVRKSDGLVIAVSDERIIAATKALANREGVFAEPTGAVAVAGALELSEQGQFQAGDKVISVVTGMGFKDIGTLKPFIDTQCIPTIQPSSEDLLRHTNCQ